MTTDDNRPSIKELQEDISRWPTDWKPAIGEEGEWQGFWRCRDRDGVEDRVSADVDEDYANNFSRTVAALMNAGPAAYDVVAAAQEYHCASQDFAKGEASMHTAPNDRAYRAASSAIVGLRERRDSAYAALTNALSKVLP
jgi:hypothetical protein